MTLFRFSTTFLLIAMLWLVATPLAAQTFPGQTPTASPSAAAPAATGSERRQSPIELVSRASDTEAELERIEEETRVPPRLIEIEKELANNSAPLRKRAKRWLELVQDAHNDGQMIDIIYLWSRERSRLTPLSDELLTLSGKYDKAQKRLDVLLTTWSRAESDASDALKTPTEVSDRVKKVVGAIDSTRLQVGNRQARLLRSIADVVDLTRHIDEVIAAARAARPSLLNIGDTRRTFPLWELPSTAGWFARLSATHTRNRDLARDFIVHRKSSLLAHLLALLLTAFAVTKLAGPAASAEEHAPQVDEASGTEPVLRRRYAAATLLVLLATPLFHESAPTAIQVLLGLASVIVVLLLIPTLVPTELRPLSYLSVALFGLTATRYLLLGAVLISRLWSCLTLLMALLAFTLMLNKLRKTAPAARLSRWLGSTTAMAVVAALLFAALVANILGYVDLASIIGQAVIIGAHLAVTLYLGFRITTVLAERLLESEPFIRLAAVRNHRSVVFRQLQNGLRFGAIALWSWQLLDLFTIQMAAREWIDSTFNEKLKIGSLEVALGSVVLLIAGVFVALMGSRTVKFLLNEDVLPRTPLARGARYAVSTTASYLTMVVIFVGTLAAVGFELSQFAFIVGALSVGIGFGLQNVVNNFVSGLVLLFGRPLEVGHTIEVSGMLGEVTRIGFRSCTMRTWAGAEVIIPNADLISGQVVNWTLSDTLRRVEIPVGVAYGSDVEQVVQVLRDAVADHPKVLSEPPPEVLFVAFGDSSLSFNVRGWLLFEDYVTTRSDLLRAINQALANANIEIPFPQRDLHLRSVDGRVVTALAGASSTLPPPAEVPDGKP